MQPLLVPFKYTKVKGHCVNVTVQAVNEQIPKIKIIYISNPISMKIISMQKLFFNVGIKYDYDFKR